MKKLKVSILSDKDSWKNEFIPELLKKIRKSGHRVRWVHEIADIPQGDFLFMLGCGKIVPPAYLSRNDHNIVVHESRLPHGRGWSPTTWQVIEGAREIPLT